MTNVVDAPVCARKGCKNLGTVYMNINFINKIGIFCEICSIELLRQDLAVKLDSSTNTRSVRKEKGDSNYSPFRNLSFQKYQR